MENHGDYETYAIVLFRFLNLLYDVGVISSEAWGSVPFGEIQFLRLKVIKDASTASKTRHTQRND